MLGHGGVGRGEGGGRGPFSIVFLFFFGVVLFFVFFNRFGVLFGRVFELWEHFGFELSELYFKISGRVIKY